jgi:hypothetical protein
MENKNDNNHYNGHRKKRKLRHFRNMRREYSIESKISRNVNDKLYKLFKNTNLKTDTIHNLARDTTLPHFLKTFLTLGLNFSLPLKPNFKKIRNKVNETFRKIGWKTFFNILGQDKELDKYGWLMYDIKKKQKNTKSYSDIHDDIFPDKSSNKNIVEKLRHSSKRVSNVYTHIMEHTKNFLKTNDLIIKPADKNAGICVMKKLDYDNEIYRQLNDLSTYHPSTQFIFNTDAEELRDKIKHRSRYMNPEFKLPSLLPKTTDPATFYILPKIHKQYTDFPKGRPISSTIKTLNKPISQILDKFLQPIMNHIPDLILDTTHLLILLNNLNLDPNKNYTLITIDVDSLYTNLPISVCKKHVINYYEEYKSKCILPFNVSKEDIKMLMKWNLEHSFVKYENEFYYQHKGIQMGNNASVSIANITVFKELEPLFKQYDNIIFNKRFLDDIFLIVETSNIIDINTWLESLLKHNFLTFTYIHDKKRTNFLDLKIELDARNKIITSLYKKPMSKQEYVHYESNHPKHLLNSIPYSQGIRIMRICSDSATRESEIKNMIVKFESREYPKKLLENIHLKLRSLDRVNLLKPKQELLLNNLCIHNPEILNKLNIAWKLNQVVKRIKSDKIYAVFPFYRNIFNMSKILYNAISEEIDKCENETLKNVAKNIDVKISFSICNSIKQFVK